MPHLLSAYQFLPLTGLPLVRERMRATAARLALKGTVLLADEGINFAVGGAPEAIDEWLDWLRLEYGIKRLVAHRQPVEVVPFLRLKVRIRPEIITFDPALDPGVARTGEALSPTQWHALLHQGAVQLVDTRNDYEVAIGSFRDALNPAIDSFTEFGAWALKQLDPDRPVAMFCTGGVRCEKASAWLLAQGFGQVYHLRGGILAYIQHFGGEDSLWQGECFVFDDRVSVDAALQASGRPICAGCRRPHHALPDDGMPPVDEQGDCRLCGTRFEPARLAGVRERVRQIMLARQRGQSHLGPPSEPKPAQETG